MGLLTVVVVGPRLAHRSMDWQVAGIRCLYEPMNRFPPFLILIAMMLSLALAQAEDHHNKASHDGGKDAVSLPEAGHTTAHAIEGEAFTLAPSSSSRDYSPVPDPTEFVPMVLPGPKPSAESSDVPDGRVRWTPLIKGSLFYLGVMHSFRFATEAGTREGLHNSVVGGYFKALGAMHGWSDGDGYYENYLGHPIEGAVSAYIWMQNDQRYRGVQFGGDRDYWMSRLRAYAFAWAFSEQFEIGPISEASLGQIQRYCCAYGLVDHVITPNGGLVWVIAGDALDRYVTVPIENRTHNVGVRILARLALNPPQSFANVMMLHYPWRRENRSTVSQYDGQMYLRPSATLAAEPGSRAQAVSPIPRFEMTAALPALYRVGGRNCLGGGGVGAFRVSDFWQWTAEVSGCTLGNSLPANWSGDSLTFTFGPQWIVHTIGRWTPHAHFRVGGQKVTEELVDPKARAQVLSSLPPGTKLNRYYDLYTKHWESTGFSLSVGGGLDVGLTRAFALRVANLEYVRSWLGSLNGTDFDRGLRITTGVVLRVGTW